MGIGDMGIFPSQSYSGWDGSIRPAVDLVTVVSNYTLRLNKSSYTIFAAGRPENDTESWRYTIDNAIKMEQVGAMAVLSDDLAPLWGYDRNATHGSYVNSIYPIPAAPERYQYLQKFRITNHDFSYNLLFTDGAVKTYSDGSRDAWRKWCDYFVYNGSYPDTSDESLTTRMNAANTEYALEYFIWRPYLDGAYEQD